MTEELLEVLWVLEATTAVFPQLKLLFGEIVASETFRADELPQPTPNDRDAPYEERELRQHGLPI